MNLMSQFADPAGIESLSLTEKLAGAGITTVIGVGITFTVLILLWVFIVSFGKVIAGFGKQLVYEGSCSSSVCAAGKSADMASGRKRRNFADAESGDDIPQGELVAVIAAATSAYSEKNIKSISIRKVGRAAGDVWTHAGRWENMR